MVAVVTFVVRIKFSIMHNSLYSDGKRKDGLSGPSSPLDLPLGFRLRAGQFTINSVSSSHGDTDTGLKRICIPEIALS